MKYATGQAVKLNDKVGLGQDQSGIVVCDIDSDAYTADYPEAEWSHLRQGVLIRFPSYGLIHYQQGMEPGVRLLARETSIQDGTLAPLQTAV